jgi:hypothetical protein
LVIFSQERTRFFISRRPEAGSIMKKLAGVAINMLLYLLWLPEPVHAAVFFCPSGNVTCLIAAINAANWNGAENTIFLEPGTYTLRSVNNNTDGPNGLPSIKGRITIRQDEMAAIIERDPAAQPFRLFHVDSGGRLTLFGLALRYGQDQSDFGGGAISNRGVLKIDRLAIYDNTKTTGPTQTNTTGGAGINNLGGQAFIVHSEIGNNAVTEDEFVNGLGGGIFNGPWAGLGGDMEITGSFIYGNRSVRVGGGIFTGGSLKVTSSAIYDNVAADSDGFGGGGGVDIQAGGVVTFSNSTIARNQASGGGVSSSGEWTAINSTIAGNDGFTDISLGRSRANVQNSIVGRCFAGPDFGTFNSLGNNIIGTPAGCQAQFQPTDLVTDPRLDQWNADGAYFPLLPDSPAVDSANTAACPATDQLGNPRLGVCDRGSVEFQGGRMLVAVDIRPKKDANRINPGTSKNINVAIFSVNGFDATNVDPNSVRFGATGTEAASIHVARRDVDGDGTHDMVVRFQIQDTGIKCGDTSAALTGQVFNGASFIGSSPIRTVQCKENSHTFVSRNLSGK